MKTSSSASDFPWEDVYGQRTTQIPHSIEAEKGVLGCILISPNESINDCTVKLRPGAQVFYDLKHQVIYSTIMDMFEKKEAIDIITVHQRLKDSQQIDQVGGVAYLASLPDEVPSAANISFYISVLIQKYVMRQMFLHCTQFQSDIFEHSGEVDTLLEKFESDAMAIRNSVSPSTESDIKELVKNRVSFYEECAERGGGLVGLSTGFHDLDKMTSGLKGGDMVVIAARPSVGKTSLAMNIAENLAVGQNIPVGVFSLEMSSESLVGRMIASTGRVSERNLISGAASEREIQNTFSGAVKISKAPIFIDDTAGLTIGQLKAKARRMAQRSKVKLVVIDYVQLLRANRVKNNRQEEIAEISTGIKGLAKELRIPVIAICQLNRELDKDKERKPRMSDLRESGQIEQDADIIGMLYAADPEEAARGADVLRVNLLIIKQRNGPTGDVPLTFFKQFTRFENASKIEIQDPPRSWLPKED